jgi:N-acetyltransferase 10
MMALYVASHYKNSPNDLQLMADAPAHHLFVLLGMERASCTTIPFWHGNIILRPLFFILV